jgi:hypothetical protein
MLLSLLAKRRRKKIYIIFLFSHLLKVVCNYCCVIRPAAFIFPESSLPATHCQLTLHDLGSLSTNNVVSQWPES